MTVNSLGAQELSYLSGMSATQGYEVLNKTMKQAVTNFENTATSKSDITYFEQNAPKATSVSNFLSNTRLVDFVLSAFGLDSEDGYQGLIKQVLTQDPNASGSLVNQLSDPRFKQMATALDFYDDGLSKLQAVGLSDPTTATSAEGVSFAPSASASTIVSTASNTAVITTSVNTNITVGIGVQLGSNQYFAVQEPVPSGDTTDATGPTGYAQSGYFTVSNNQLTLPDGSVLPNVTVPSDTTSLNITSDGTIEAQENGSAAPTIIGQLQVSTFSDPTQLTTDSNGYKAPTTGSGSASSASIASLFAFGATNQVQTTYQVPSTSSSTSASTSASGAIGVGIGISDAEYLPVTRPDGTTAYVKSGYFTLNSSNQLSLPDGSLLTPPLVFPSDVTAITVTSSGGIYALEKGSASATSIGVMEVATFSKPSDLSQDKNGFLTPTTNSGAANLNPLAGTAFTFTQTNQDLVNQYIQQEFETAVGSSNTAVREALYFQRTIGTDEKSVGTTASSSLKADVVLGDSVLANVAETILAQPAQIAYEQLSRQESIIETGLNLNELASSSSSSYIASLTSRYLSEYDASTSASSNAANSPALQILSAFSSGSSSSSSSGSSILSLFA